MLAGISHWIYFERMSKVIADESQRSGYFDLCEAATRLSLAAKSPDDKQAVGRSLIKLIGAVGRTGRPNNRINPVV